MIRSLRKGQTTIEVWHSHGQDTIGAKQAEVELVGDVAVFRFTISPVDGNQSYDANSIFLEATNQISRVIVRDEHIYKNTSSFLKSNRNSISRVNLEIIYGQKTLFSVGLKSLNDDGIQFDIKA